MTRSAAAMSSCSDGRKSYSVTAMSATVYLSARRVTLHPPVAPWSVGQAGPCHARATPAYVAPLRFPLPYWTVTDRYPCPASTRRTSGASTASTRGSKSVVPTVTNTRLPRPPSKLGRVGAIMPLRPLMLPGTMGPTPHPLT